MQVLLDQFACLLRIWMLAHRPDYCGGQQARPWFRAGIWRRKSLLGIVWVCLSGCLLCPSVGNAEAQGPVTIDNGIVRLTVNPSVGRIVEFGRQGGPNLLRVTDNSILTEAKEVSRAYRGYGGDQLWPAQQARWGSIRGSGGAWPPLNELDGPNWTITDQGPLHVTIRAPETPLLGLTVDRTITLAPNSADVEITNRFERTAIRDPETSHDVMIWSVTGLTEPEFTLVGVSPDRPNPDALWSNLLGRSDSIITVVDQGRSIRFDVRSHGPSQPLGFEATKIGAYGDWLAAVYADDVLLQRSAYEVGGPFPDGAALEIYSSQKSGSEYIELEVLSKSLDLKLGETLSNRVDWHLVNRPENANDDELAALLRAVPEPSSFSFLLPGCAALFAAGRRRKERAT